MQNFLYKTSPLKSPSPIPSYPVFALPFAAGEKENWTMEAEVFVYTLS